MRWVLLFVPLLGVQAEQSLTADVDLLSRIRVKMAENLQRLPNYTCAEEISRSAKLPSSRRMQTLDTVRLEVAMVDGHELYGWVGANRIAESELSSLVGGTIGNGDFGLLARSIFLAQGAQFTFAGESEQNGRKSIQFDYRVPLLSSGYHLKVGAREAVVGYHGSVRVDPNSLDLLSFNLSADDIPEYLGLSSSTKALTYAQTEIGSSKFLLPASSELAMVSFNGSESQNVTRFHNCRQYAGESVLSFADPAPDPESAKKPPIEAQTVELPEEFQTEISLLTPIDSEKAAVGDEVQVRLAQNIKSGRTRIAPKGAILTGRITKLQHIARAFHLSLSFHSLDFDGSHADLSGRDNTVLMITPSAARPSFGRGLGSFDSLPSEHPIEIEASRLQLPRGFLLSLHSRLVKSERQ